MVNVLVVEDEELIASFLEKGLRAHGYGVVWARNGREGLERAAASDIALVILDLGLPDLDGLEVLQRLRERGADVPVLVLSARSQVADRVAGLNLGADDYLGKPFAFEELLARVEAVARRPRALSSYQRSFGCLPSMPGVGRPVYNARGFRGPQRPHAGICGRRQQCRALAGSVLR